MARTREGEGSCPGSRGGCDQFDQAKSLGSARTQSDKVEQNGLVPWARHLNAVQEDGYAIDERDKACP